MTTCEMVIVELPSLKVVWECSECMAQLKATKVFEQRATCPQCKAVITKWVGEDDYDE